MNALDRYAAQPARLVIGLMSGTSADGIDAALCRLAGSGETLRAELLSFHCYPFAEEVRRAVMALFLPEAPVTEVCRMNVVLGRAFGEVARDLMQRNGLAAVDLVASHGQTVCHLPVERATLQLGEPAVIAELTGAPVVADFRPRDLAAGGEGAPLVPYADWALFRHADLTRAVQNIGGIGNVTVVPAGGRLEEVIAFDTGPGNMVIDALVSILSGGASTYDQEGAWAARGAVNDGLLQSLLQHSFLARRPPKSTGREEFGEPFARQLLARSTGLAAEDLLATATAFTAETIARSYRNFVAPRFRIDEVILGGGGSYNSTLRRMLAERLPGVPLRRHEDFGIPSEAKEALAFALLGNETMLGRPANVPSATGAAHPVVLGKIVLP